MLDSDPEGRAMPEPRAERLLPPHCIHLQSKNIIKAARPMLTDDDVMDQSRHCWCNRTGQVLGPDRFVAEPSECRKGRECFESPLEDLL